MPLSRIAGEGGTETWPAPSPASHAGQARGLRLTRSAPSPAVRERVGSSGRHLQVQQAGGVAAEDCLALGVVEAGGALDEADRVGFAHIGGVVGADQDVFGAIRVDE